MQCRLAKLVSPGAHVFFGQNMIPKLYNGVWVNFKVYYENSFFHLEMTSRAVPVSEVRISQTACVFCEKIDPNALKWCVGQF